MLISEKIKEMRKKEGYTQEQLANELSVSRSTITNWETGKSVPDDNKIKAISSLFNISVEDLINENINIEEAKEDEATKEVETIKAEETAETLETEERNKATEKIEIPGEVNTEEKSFQKNGTTTKTNSTLKNKILRKINIKNKKMLIPLLSSILAIILLIIVITEVVPFIGKCIDMSKAEKLMNSGDYIAASEIYSSINSEKAQEKYNECIYTYANYLHNNDDYENAISQIDSISYKDSNELSKAWNYEYALYNIKTGNYPKSIELLESLNDYNGSDLKLKELCNYYGTKLYNAKNFKDAVTYLKKSSENSDLYYNALYNYAVELNNNQNLIDAYNIFQDLAKVPYYNSAEIAQEILSYIFLRGGNVWSYSPQGSNDIFQYTFHNNKFFLYIKKSNASSYHTVFTYESLLFTSEDFGIENSKEPIILVGVNANNTQDIVFLTFDIKNNSKVDIHTHSLSSTGKCLVFCGNYNATHTLDFSKYSTKYKNILTETALPRLSFASEIENTSINTSNTNIQNAETINIATELEQNTTQISPELNTTSVNSESNVYNQNYISNNDTSKSSNEDFYNPSKYAQNQNSAINSSNNTQKPNVTSNPCANGHSWKDATCTSPATCSICGKTSGSPLEHSYRPATCTSPKMCKYCKTTVGTVAPHNMYYTKCQNCDYTDFSEYTLTSNTFCLDSWYYLDSKTHYLEDGEASINIDSNGVCKVTFDKYSYTFTLVQSDVDAYGLHFKCYMNGEYLKNAEVTFFFEQNRCDFFVYGGTLGFSQVSLNFDM